MIDWWAIKNEYICTRISTRDLAAKHGVSYSTLEKRARKEGWTAERGRIEASVRQKAVEAVSAVHVDCLTQIIDSSEKAVKLLVQLLDEMEQNGKIRVYEIKAITEALKNVSHIYHTNSTQQDRSFDKVRELLASVPDALN